MNTRPNDFWRRNEAWLWLTLIIIAAAAIRFNGMTSQSYWFDELFSAYYSKPTHSFWQVVNLTLADIHPPLYQLVMWLSYKLFGYNEFAGRLPSVLAGIAVVPIIYLLGRELSNRKTGLYAAALAVPNYYLVYYAQEARSYSFLYSLCGLSFLFFFRALRSESKSNLFWYVASTVALLYTHYFVFVALAAQGLILIAFMLSERQIDKSLLARSALAFGALGLALLPLIPPLLEHSSIDNFWIVQPSSWFFVTYFVQYFKSPVLSGMFFTLALIGVFLGLYSGRGSRGFFAAIALLIWIAVGYFLPWLRGVFAQAILTDRNTILLVPPILLLASMGLLRLQPNWLQRCAFAALFFYTAWHLFVVIDYDDAKTKAQYRELATSLATFDPPLPIYTLKYNDTKYNVYFEQQRSGLHAKDAAVLVEKLEAGTAEGVFWLADGQGRSLQTDIDEQFGLVEVTRYKHLGTAAVLLVNPAAAINLSLKLIEDVAGDELVYVSDKFALLPGKKLVLGIGPREQVESVTLELLDEQANVLTLISPEFTGMDAAFIFDPQVALRQPVSMRIRTSANRPIPQLWVMDASVNLQD